MNNIYVMKLAANTLQFTSGSEILTVITLQSNWGWAYDGP